MVKIIQTIIKRLKTGCQWREISVKDYFGEEKISWQNVYYFFNKWCKDGSFKNIWVQLLNRNKRLLDMSCVQLDGSQTRCRMGGESTGYQSRKSAKTSNMIFLCDNDGQMLSMGNPRSGNHHDLYEIEDIMGEIIEILSEAEISHKGLFLNADSGFDSENLRQKLEMEEIIGNIKTNPRNGKTVDNNHYFDEKLYESRFRIEQANAWLDGFKALLIRFETLDITWKNMHFLAFSLRLIKKLKV